MNSNRRSAVKSTLAAALFALLAMIAPATAQSDATLSGLAPSAGTLAPAFASGTLSYTATVPYATTDISVTPTATDLVLPTITVNGNSVASGSPSANVSLSVGANVISTVVVSQDTLTTVTYTMSVTRETPNVDLSGLAPSEGTLAPAFASGTISYTASVPTATTDITVTPTVVNALATITVNGSPVTSGNPSDSIALSMGSNTITTVVTGEDLLTTKTYTLTVTRGPKTLFSSGTKAWDTTTANWGLITAGPFNTAVWSNSDGGDNATLQGTAGTVTLGEPISIKNLTFTHTSTATYTVTGSTLNFTAGSIVTNNPNGTTNTANALGAIISSNITGAPSVNANALQTNEVFTFRPAASGSQSIGSITGGAGNAAGIMNFEGGSGHTSTVTTSTGPKAVFNSSGTWTVTGVIDSRNITITAGTVTVSSGRLQSTTTQTRGITMTGGTLNWNNAGAIREQNGGFGTNSAADPSDFYISGGTIDNTSGAAITTSTYNPDMVWAGNWTFSGSNGANSNLFLGNGRVALAVNTQVTVSNTAATLTVGGVIQHLSGSFGLTKAGPGSLLLSGASTYTGSTTIAGGAIIVGANAPSGAAGALGNASSAIVLGNGSSAGAPSLFINGAFTVGRAISVGSVANTNAFNAVIGGTNTSGTSTFSGNITLNTAATNYSVILRAFSGGTVDFTTPTWTTNNKAIAIGSSGIAGTVRLSTALATTGGINVNFGTLELNSAFTGNMNLASGVTLAGTGSVSGTLGVTGAAVINLGTSGVLTFGDSKLANWTGGALNVTGTLGATSLRFGDSADDLTLAQLALISVNGTGTYVLDVNGYLVPGGGPGPVNSFEISAIASPQTVGTPITGITITAKDSLNATATGFTGTVTFGGTGGFTGTSATFTAGVLSGVSVTPTVAGSNLTLTVDDGASHTGSVTITTIQTQYQAWAGGALFDADANGDGVDNGLAFLLGASSPNVAVIQPTVTQSGGNLVLSNFSSRNLASRGTATLSVQHSSDLGIGDPWTTVLVPDATAAELNGVSYDITPGTPLNTVNTATISVSQAASGKLFGRLKAEQP